MTGIGFLGAGVIIKEGLSVRGLTTAASIWITAAIGILAGIGFYFPLVISVVLTLGVLSLFRWIEARMPSQAYYHFSVRFARSAGMSERQLRELVESHGFSIANFTYRLEPEGVRRHSMVIRSADRSGAGRLSVTLENMEPVLEFRIAPTGD
jgi:putative Mg2+ transporter-C (MgtC) family protein